MDNTLQRTQKLFDRNEDEIQESQKKYGGVYISRVEEDDGLNLEVETDSGTIAFTLKYTADAFAQGSPDQESRYQELIEFLESNEIFVFEDHDEWQEILALESDSDEDDEE